MFAIYLRVSTNKQETRSQKHDVYAWCEKQGYAAEKLIEYVDQGLSGSRYERPGLQRMLADVKNKKITKIITFESSRISRDFMDFLRIMAELSESGVELEIPGKGVQNFSSSTDKLIMAVQGFVANQFIEDHSKRVKAGMAARKKRDPKIKFGAPSGNQNRIGKKKEHPARLTKRIAMLNSKGMTTRQIAETLEMSQTKVSRLIRAAKKPS
jgi:site-specific DNA recombinase